MENHRTTRPRSSGREDEADDRATGLRQDTVPIEIPRIDEAAPPVAPATSPQMIIVTGMSGAGRSRAANALEDHPAYENGAIP